MTATKIKTFVATLLALLLLPTAVTCLFVFVLVPRDHATGPLTFAGLREADIPGRYKLTDGAREMWIVLYDDHTFMNEDGTIYPQYRWDIEPDGFSLTWQRSITRFTNIEAAGGYTWAKPGGASSRLEKLPPYTPAQLVPPAPIASIQLGTPCQTNGLTPVNSSDDGEILPGDVAGRDCHRLVRNPNRNDACLCLRIAPELKDPPFTNALLLVEFFDRASAVGLPGRLVVHYDDERGGPYMASQPLRLTGSQSWQEATFYLPTPLFQNRQDAGGDLRLAASRSELPVRSIRLLKNVPLPETKMPALTTR